MDDVELVAVADADKPVLANLLQFYCYEFSAIRGYDVTEHGVFTYKYLDHYFVEPDRVAYFIRHDGALAGFVLSRVLPSGDREMSEFFVLRHHRRGGVGRRAAQQVFARYPGRWEVAFDDANEDAVPFWPGVVEAVATGAIDVEHVGGEHPKTVRRFSTAGD